MFQSFLVSNRMGPSIPWHQPCIQLSHRFKHPLFNLSFWTVNQYLWNFGMKLFGLQSMYVQCSKTNRLVLFLYIPLAAFFCLLCNIFKMEDQNHLTDEHSLLLSFGTQKELARIPDLVEALQTHLPGNYLSSIKHFSVFIWQGNKFHWKLDVNCRIS